MVRKVRLETVVCATAAPALLAIISGTAGLGVAGWLAGLAVGWTTAALLTIGRAQSGGARTGPADWVTLTRAVLTAGIAGLVADSFAGSSRDGLLVGLATVALVLDGVDGQLARRTGTMSELGARFDGEVDAFLILVLSAEVSRHYGVWVLAIGAYRYALLVAGWAVPWLAAQLPPRYWRKVVAAVQGIVLTAAASGLLSRPAGIIAVGGALALLTESFGHDVRWLYRHGAGPTTRTALRLTTAVVSTAIVWTVLVIPDRLDRISPASLFRIPVEGLVFAAVCLLLPSRRRRYLAAFAGVAGVAFGLVTVLKLLDMGFYDQIGRAFDPLLDWSELGPAVGVLRDSVGTVAATALVVLAGLGLVLVVVVVTTSTLRLSTLLARHRRGAARTVVSLAAVSALSAALTLQLTPGDPLASTTAARLAVDQVRDASSAVRDQQRFSSAISAADPYARIPTARLLTGLRGKDVLIVFVESYGQVAVQGSSFAAGVDAVLVGGTATLARSGYSARSAFLTSPTFGGISWLAHSTLQSGLWVNNQHRYDQLMSSRRLTLTSAFGRAGWRTVADTPSDDRPWAAGTSFYHYDQLYNRLDVGYRGPAFSYASMPDQYTLAAFQRLELGRRPRPPVMAEIDLVSSHTPWTPLPRLVPWNEIGDGSVFDPMPAQGLSPSAAWRDAGTVRSLYGQSIQYSMQALVSWITALHDKNLVVVVLGDHQPATTVSGPDVTQQVPISIIAADQAVFGAVASWQWQAGLLPSPTAPVWPMDAFRDRFLAAFSTAEAEAAPGPH